MPLATHFSIALVIYLALLAAFAFSRPALMFSADGKPKRWGAQLSEHESPFAPAFVMPFLAVVVYLLVSLAQLGWKRAPLKP